MEFKLIKDSDLNEFEVGQPIFLYGLIFALTYDDGTTEYLSAEDCNKICHYTREDLQKPGQYSIAFYPAKVEDAPAKGLVVEYPFYIKEKNITPRRAIQPRACPPLTCNGSRGVSSCIPCSSSKTGMECYNNS